MKQYGLIAKELRDGSRVTATGVTMTGALSRKDFKILLAKSIGIREQDKRIMLLLKKV